MGNACGEIGQKSPTHVDNFARNYLSFWALNELNPLFVWLLSQGYSPYISSDYKDET